MCFETIRMMDAYKYIGKTGILLIDLREKDDYIRGHIPGAWNLPYEEEEDPGSFIEKVRRLMAKRLSQSGITIEKLMLYCDRGNVSMLAARDLYRAGIRVINLYGGFHAYHGCRVTGLNP